MKLLVFLMLSVFSMGMGADLITMEWEALGQSKKMVEESNEYIMPSYERVMMLADEALKFERLTVVDKKILAPSGDPHDYMSFGPYWWPNPETKDGLPYVNRDGEVNPESRKADKERMVEFTETIETLGLAYYFTGDKKYAEKSAELMRVWFIDKETRMNPNLKYGQGIPGRVEGRSIGIIDSRVLLRVLDGIALIDKSQSVKEDELVLIKKWFKEFNNWLIDGEYSREVENLLNNHGTYYDIQVAGIAIFLGDEKVARDVIERSQERRLASHIDLEGKNPKELERTRPYHYSVFDLEALLTLAHYSERYDDIDHYNYSKSKSYTEIANDFLYSFNRSQDDVSSLGSGSYLKMAIDFLNRYAFDLDTWSKDGYLGRSEKNPKFERAYLSLAQASRVYGLDKYKENLYKAWEGNPSSRDILKWPIDFKN